MPVIRKSATDTSDEEYPLSQARSAPSLSGPVEPNGVLPSDPTSTSSVPFWLLSNERVVNLVRLSPAQSATEQTGHSKQSINEIHRVSVGREPGLLDLGVPVVTDAGALREIQALPSDLVEQLVDTLTQWISASDAIRHARVSPFHDPEDPAWVEILIELFTSAEDREKIQLWEDVGRTIDRLLESFSEENRIIASEQLAVHVLNPSEDD